MGKSGGISQKTQDAEVGIAQQQTDIAKTQSERSGELFSAAFPGFQQSENYYQTLASGDPAAISRAIAPATQQINAQAQGNKKRIEEDAPRGGEKNLALAENEINKGAMIGETATKSFLDSFKSLAGLAGQGIGESTSSAGTAISGLSAAGNQYSNIAQQQAEGKASQLGFISSLAGSATSMAAMCWIAIELWGEDDLRTKVVRYFFNEVLMRSWWGRIACGLYRRYGQRVAKHIQTSPKSRAFFTKLFEWIYVEACIEIPEPELSWLTEDYWTLWVTKRAS